MRPTKNLTANLTKNLTEKILHLTLVLSCCATLAAAQGTDTSPIEGGFDGSGVDPIGGGNGDGAGVVPRTVGGQDTDPISDPTAEASLGGEEVPLVAVTPAARTPDGDTVIYAVDLAGDLWAVYAPEVDDTGPRGDDGPEGVLVVRVSGDYWLTGRGSQYEYDASAYPAGWATW